MSAKKFLTPEVWENNLLQYKLNQQNQPYPTPPQSSNGHVNHLGGEGRNGFDTLVNVIHQQNGWQAFMWQFSRLKFCISRLKIRRYNTNGKRKFKRMLSFLFVGKRKFFAMKLSFEEFNLTADRSALLVLNQPRQRGF